VQIESATDSIDSRRNFIPAMPFQDRCPRLEGWFMVAMVVRKDAELEAI
jgi:hypothetical protein